MPELSLEELSSAARESQLGSPFETLQQVQSEIAPMIGEAGGTTAGAATGARIGGSIGSLFGPTGTATGATIGAIGGGALGAAGGRAGGVQFSDRELQEGELGTAAARGAAGPVANQLAKLGVRLFTGIPSLRKSIRLSKLQMNRAEAVAATQGIENFAKRSSGAINRSLFEIDKQIKKIQTMTPKQRVAEFGTTAAANQKLVDLQLNLTREMVQGYKNLIPKHMKKAFLDPDAVLSRVASMVKLPENMPGATSGVVSLWFTGSLTGAAVGGTIGWTLGRLGRSQQDRLIRMVPFHRWVSNARVQPLGQAALSFISDVMLQSTSSAEAKAAKEFYDLMLEAMEEEPAIIFYEPSLELSGEAAGSTALQLSEQGRQQLQQPQTSEFTPRGSGPRIGINLQ